MTTPEITTSESIVIELSADHLAKLDELRDARNVSRSQFVAELIDHAKPDRRARRADGGQQPNPWAQVWPGG